MSQGEKLLLNFPLSKLCLGFFTAESQEGGPWGLWMELRQLAASLSAEEISLAFLLFIQLALFHLLSLSLCVFFPLEGLNDFESLWINRFPL